MAAVAAAAAAVAAAVTASQGSTLDRSNEANELAACRDEERKEEEACIAAHKWRDGRCTVCGRDVPEWFLRKRWNKDSI